MTESTDSGVERFRGPDYLTDFAPDPDAITCLQNEDSHTARRLVKYARGDWPGLLSGEDFLGPLAQTDGEVVLRVVSAPGNDWIWWRGAKRRRHVGRTSTAEYMPCRTTTITESQVGRRQHKIAWQTS